MQRLKKFIKTTVLGGLIVLLPVFLTGFFLHWLFNLVTGFIRPLANILVIKARIQENLADVLVIVVIIGVFFLTGLVVKTRLGRYIHRVAEKRILKIMPGYTIFRNTIKQFLGQKKTPFSRVALVQAFGNETLMTAFVTDEHPNGSFTVFAPSALNPTTGLILHLPGKYVHIVDVSVEDTMRSIITCGAGSCKLISRLPELRKQCPVEEEDPDEF
jgi:uncharacterized membrane protein